MDLWKEERGKSNLFCKEQSRQCSRGWGGGGGEELSCGSVSYGCAESELRVSRVNILLQGNFQGNMCKGEKKKASNLKLESLSLSAI